MITPHADDIARLLSVDRGAVEANPLAAAQRAAERHGCVVMMKVAQSSIVSPSGEPWLYGGGGLGLATSGPGDVLAGVVAEVFARGMEATTAAARGSICIGKWGDGSPGASDRSASWRAISPTKCPTSCVRSMRAKIGARKTRR
ncbi:NAD(P)H-hydrate dehydratase [Methylorubrum extorquens]|uniref:NAD(P)H-hydrate dehydratase n=1 Tax=Methylorubrum TaxID=2282523 RepID=UPI003F59ACAC|nr:NAD(P)H-hydrate repair Nnr-like enzyme with NAD(P)H-hydrate dehydratase domain [Methylorubrum zatmanii]MCP1552627.1 NAD(P)H-hydrate repair Nnr-like enzyme with NAD(P)H-hydrate dehydratase domain [Methylorubrum extorquens]MCP1581063.1 NAD(P)H-hydrate repair Nnr-like enzyme with NAD(P)H-hydrate dehydratase domain [Methylorubrum extorquens]